METTVKTIIETRHVEKILELLDEVDLLGSTKEIEDKKALSHFNTIFKDACTLLITTCHVNQKKSLINKIFPAISMIGGICLA